MNHAPLEAVYIYFDTATYDEIERDEKVTLPFNTAWYWFRNYFKVTMEAQLGLIGGTMGLLTGFSILSAVEIVYFLLRYLRLSLTTFQSLPLTISQISQVLHVAQDWQNWGGVCCQEKIWKPFDKEGLRRKEGLECEENKLSYLWCLLTLHICTLH